RQSQAGCQYSQPRSVDAVLAPGCGDEKRARGDPAPVAVAGCHIAMKTFQFRLARVLDWRRTELEMEETRLERLHTSMAAIDRERAGLESARDQAVQSLMARASVDGAELQLLSNYRAALESQCARLEQKRREREQETAAQQQKLLAARRRLRLLENL